ncbi:MAG: hypothetical protein RBS80_00415 [Thermoguttaceae bacterium]|jgi:hypothetical protein|nr:hypothetical protein [Thermoguttaceae bacterium]
MREFRQSSIGLLVVCLAFTASPPVTAGLIENGSFEADTGGKFDSWNYTDQNFGPTSKTVASVSTTPAVIGGTKSASLVPGTTNGGFLFQTVSAAGLPHFTIDFDFAVLPGTSGRTLGLVTNDELVNFAVYYAANGAAELRFYPGPGGSWQSTGLSVSTTPSWDQTPVVNHLKLEGTDYGTLDASLTATLTGGVADGTFTCTPILSTTKRLTTFGFQGYYRDTAFLVDNVSVIPEPCTFMMLGGALAGLLCCTRRRRG